MFLIKANIHIPNPDQASKNKYSIEFEINDGPKGPQATNVVKK